MRKREKNSASGFGDEEISEVCVTPLADVSLTLVIMMMVIAPMVFQSMIQVKPSFAVASKKTPAAKEKPLYVDITSNGLSLNSQVMNSEHELFNLLQRSLNSKKDRTVLITSAADVQYDMVIRILDLVKQSGAANLSLVPRKKI